MLRYGHYICQKQALYKHQIRKLIPSKNKS